MEEEEDEELRKAKELSLRGPNTEMVSIDYEEEQLRFAKDVAVQEDAVEVLNVRFEGEVTQFLFNKLEEVWESRTER